MNLTRPLYTFERARQIRAQRWHNILILGGIVGAFIIGRALGYDAGVADALRGLR